MKRINTIPVVLSLLMFASSALSVHGQEGDDMIKYTSDFKFKDGIYLNFDQVKADNPIPKAKLLTSADYNDRDFFKKVLASDKIYFYDEMGVRQEIQKTDIWGFSRNGIVYVMIQGNYNRVTFIGNICHFVADVTTVDYRNSSNYYSPYGYYDPYYSPYSYYGGYYPMGSYYSPYNSPYGSTGSTHSEIKQYIIDFESGKIMEFTYENVEILLMKDPTVYDEYVQLPKQKKKELMFVYVRKFNEKNPLYLPAK